MMYEQVIRDFAKRTLGNMRVIDELKEQGREVYEVTQLVNSTLGLLVFPQQEYVKRIPNTPLDQLTRDGWPVPKVGKGFDQVQDLNQLIRYLRNAIAHFNIEFIGDGQDQLHLLRVWNVWRGKKTWEAELSVTDLRGIAERFIELLMREVRSN
ncbi:MAG: hypothetical protein HY913_08915 [Desulfomonile tiedjei]|nr:hypothetical protein [Desulfomonile tiedjei]